MSAHPQACEKDLATSRLSWLDRFARDRVRSLLGQMQHANLRIEDDFGIMESRDATDIATIVHVHDIRTYRQILLGGSIGAAEAYMDGHWSAPDLAGVCRAFARQKAVLDAMDRGLGRLKSPFLKLLHVARRNTRAGSRRNIAAHYDLSNEFFASFLDPTMTYSSGYFTDEYTSLEQASIEKYDRLCRKLELKPADHLLEIGCGWGGFACYAAKTYGCNVTAVTVSNEQFKYASSRVVCEGLDRRVQIRLLDYRDIVGQYDKIVSIEMVEAVGQEYYPQYFKTCSRLLKPEGLFAIQAITIPEQMYDFARRNVDFIKRYIFPGGGLPSITAISETIRKHTDLKMLHLEDFGAHYAETLRRWHDAFLLTEEQVREMGFDDHFVRMWRYYLAYCEAGFDERLTGVSQIVFAGPKYRSAVPSTLKQVKEAAVP